MEEEAKATFDLNAADHSDGFVVVSYHETDTRIVTYCLRLHPRLVEKVLANQDILKLEGRVLYRALTDLGAYAGNAMYNAAGHLVALPAKDKRDGLKIKDIVPALQKFDRDSGFRFLVKYSDHMDQTGGWLDDPLPGVAAHRETAIRPPHHTLFLAHFNSGDFFAPPVDDKGHRKAEEQCYYPDTGGIFWIRNRRSYDGTQPLFEMFDRNGHPLYLENETTDAANHVFITVEEFNETTGDVLSALRRDKDGRHTRPLSPDEIKNLPVPEDPGLLLG